MRRPKQDSVLRHLSLHLFLFSGVSASPTASPAVPSSHSKALDVLWLLPHACDTVVHRSVVSLSSNWAIKGLFSSSTEVKWFKQIVSQPPHCIHLVHARSCGCHCDTQEVWVPGAGKCVLRRQEEWRATYSTTVITRCVLWTRKLWEAALEHDNFVCPY